MLYRLMGRKTGPITLMWEQELKRLQSVSKLSPWSSATQVQAALASAVIAVHWKKWMRIFKIQTHHVCTPPYDDPSIRPGCPSGLKSRNSPKTVLFLLKKILDERSLENSRTIIFIEQTNTFVNPDLHMAWDKTQGNIRRGATENHPR